MDRVGLRKAWGGAAAGTIATHIAPDAILNNKLKGYAPYGNGSGDVKKAMAEMKLSKYDKNKDGLCDASVCKNIFTVHGDSPVRAAMVPVMEASMKKIGITLKTRILKDPYPPLQTPRQNLAFSLAARLGQGLRRRDDVRRPALRRPQHHRPEQHQLLAARHHAGHGQEGRRQGQHHRRSERERRSRQVRSDDRRPRA